MATKRSNGEGYYRERTQRRVNAAGKVTERKLWECQLTLPDGKRKSIYAPTLAELKRKHKDATNSNTPASSWPALMREVRARRNRLKLDGRRAA
jgi:hypothetical protein